MNPNLTCILWIVGWVVGILAVLFVVIIFVLGYIFNLSWVGVGSFQTSTSTSSVKSVWDWVTLVLIPAGLLGVFKGLHDTDQNRTFTRYKDTQSTLISQSGITPEDVKPMLYANTAATLPLLDNKRKQALITFLKYGGFIVHSTSEPLSQVRIKAFVEPTTSPPVNQYAFITPNQLNELLGQK